ncbi:SURF1 family protein [Sphingomonas lutea]|uniref:SURF1-like protein n=1 Tax=Sphingomonas lutea TaxID=1045317 RepID=A0A7G9SJ40_9SPHN|nr:SURF1 family protein [Sphingomonas lutea]QNN67865.1 SURF1 family protein [Sphingomonas lutea]
MKRLPLIPTIVVLAAVAVMIGLGVWQLQRAKWKEGLLAQYAAAQKKPPISWPTMLGKDETLPLFRYATGMCVRPVGRRAVAGQNRAGESGYAHVVDCMTGGLEGPGMSVEIGWSKDPNARIDWRGGLVSGVIAPDRRSRIRLVAATPPPGLQASAPPSTAGISNNHRMYAIQWFAFALIALVIYALAVRKRLMPEPPK